MYIQYSCNLYFYLLKYFVTIFNKAFEMTLAESNICIVHMYICILILARIWLRTLENISYPVKYVEYLYFDLGTTEESH